MISMRQRRWALHDLQGDIVGAVADSESETKLLSTYNSTGFGVPTTNSPPKYSWLGADGVASELVSTDVSTQDGSSYVPEIGRPLQTGPIASPGSFPNGTGGAGIVNAPYLGAASTQLAAASAQQWAEKEEAKKRETEERAFMEEGMCEKYPDSSACHVDGPGEGNCEVNCLTVIGGGQEGEEEAVELEPGPGGGNASAAKLEHYGRLGPCSIASEGIGVREDGLELWSFTTKIKCNSRTEGTFVIESESGSAFPEAFVAHGIHPVEFTTLLTTAAGAEVFFELIVNDKHYRKPYNRKTV
jgi:hypothetical protein